MTIKDDYHFTSLILFIYFFSRQFYLLDNAVSFSIKPTGFFVVRAHISYGHTTDFYLGKTDLPRANSSKISRGKFISGFVLPR